MIDGFDYEVAFSLCAADNDLAMKINSRLNQRIVTFLYSENQKEITFTNMMDVFPAVYRKKSRFVVVLYRKEWGEKGWTRRESSAIQDRVLDEGEGFLLFINLDSSALPTWLSPRYAYQNFDESKLDDLIMVIESRLNNAGSKIGIETPVQRAKAIHHYQQTLDRKKSFLSSEKAHEARITEIGRFIGHLKVTRQNLPLPSGFTEDRFYYEIRLSNLSLIFNFQNRQISVQLLRELRYSESRYQTLLESTFVFDCDLELNPGWVDKKSEQFFYTENLADIWLHRLLDEIDPRQKIVISESSP